MSHRVALSRPAMDDLVAVHRWIAAEAGEAIADGYIDRIEKCCAGLEQFPDRGTPRPEMGQGVRSLSFERTMMIFYRTAEDVVTILRVLHGARELREFDVE